MRSLAIAATGMNAQQTNVEVIANNIANINTTSFKRARAEFTDLLYQAERAVGVPNRGGQDPDPRRRADRPRRAHHGGPQSAHAGRADANRQQARSCPQRPRLVPGDGRQRRDVLYPRRRLQQERQRPDRDRRRLSGAADHDHPAGCHRGGGQRDGAGVRAQRHRDDAAADRPADARQFRQRCRPRAARRQPLPRNAGVRHAGDRRARRSRASARCTRAIWKTPTSIR